MSQISVVINTYNAAQHLRVVLESVKDFDEVLLCDMESTDNTLSIFSDFAESTDHRCECRAITFLRKDYNIVEPAREFAIHEAKHDWVLVVDADEIVSNELRIYLYDIIGRDNAPAGLRIPRKNYFIGQFMHCHYPDYILRFFKRDATHWPPVIHASPEVDGRVDTIPKQRKELAFVHLADDTVSLRLQKTDIYTDNELPKRQHKHYGTMALIFRPMLFFFKSYILKKAFLDGKAGFIKSVLEAYYQFVMLAKLEERRVSRL